MPPAHWLVKSEPTVYSWDQLVEDRRTLWDGVRNYEARNNLRAMRVGDLVLYYHSGDGLEIVGVARIVREAYPDPTADDETWVAVDVEPVQHLEQPVTLAAVKAESKLGEMQLVKRGRISVVPATPEEFACVLALGWTTLQPDAIPQKLPARAALPRKPAARPKPAARKKKDKNKKKKAEQAARPRKSAAKRAASRSRTPKPGRGGRSR